MWYFIWILGTLLGCSFSIITALVLERLELTKIAEADIDKEDYTITGG